MPTGAKHAIDFTFDDGEEFPSWKDSLDKLHDKLIKMFERNEGHRLVVGERLPDALLGPVEDWMNHAATFNLIWKEYTPPDVLWFMKNFQLAGGPIRPIRIWVSELHVPYEPPTEDTILDSTAISIYQERGWISFPQGNEDSTPVE